MLIFVYLWFFLAISWWGFQIGQTAGQQCGALTLQRLFRAQLRGCRERLLEEHEIAEGHESGP